MDYIKMITALTERGKDGEIDCLIDAFDMCKNLEKLNSTEVKSEKFTKIIEDETNFSLAHELVKDVRSAALKSVTLGYGGEKMLDLGKKCLLFDAPYEFDAAVRYAEFERDPKRKFYEPRRKQLLPIAHALQDLEYRKINTLGVMCPPGIGKSTLEIMFMVWSGLRNPELGILMGSHSNSFLRGVYDEIGRMLDPKGEYLWNDIFPDSGKIRTNAKDLRIDIGEPSRFETFQFSSVGSGNAGKVRASNLLVLDDLVDGIETAMSADRLEKLWQQFTVDYLQRTIGDAAILIVATPWSLHDPIDRLEQAHEGDEKAKFIHMPAVDQNDESNFDYPYGLGFTTEFYHNLRETMDDVSFRALYMCEPIEREGVLFDKGEVNFYFDMPNTDPDSIIAVCDTKDTGPDYCVMPIAYQYGSDFYIEDFVCDNSKPEIVETRLAEKIVAHKVQMARFESNRAGGRVAERVDQLVKEKGWITGISSKWSSARKDVRIVAASPFIKQRFFFKDESVCDREYKTAMRMLFSYSMIGKSNKHDDVPDALAQLVDFVNSMEFGKVEVFNRLF